MADGPSPGPHRPRVAVLGAGITGLAAAWELERGGADVVVFDPDPVAGGKLRQSDVDELAFPLDDGADAFLARVPDALELCDELGIDDLVHPATGRASVFARRELRAVTGSNVALSEMNANVSSFRNHVARRNFPLLQSEMNTPICFFRNQFATNFGIYK